MAETETMPSSMMRVGCAVPAKSSISEAELCARFVHRLQATRSEIHFRLAEAGEPADVILVMSRVANSGMAGHIQQDGAPPGEELGTALADSVMGLPQIDRFLDELIARWRPL